jgi:hypothetical protein
VKETVCAVIAPSRRVLALRVESGHLLAAKPKRVLPSKTKPCKMERNKTEKKNTVFLLDRQRFVRDIAG